MPSWTWASNNWWAFIADATQAVTFDLERGLLVIITPSLGGQRRRGAVVG